MRVVKKCVPAHNDFKEMDKQVKYLKHISRNQRPSLGD